MMTETDKKRLFGEKVLFAIFFLTGVFWAFTGIRLNLWERIAPGPGFFPFIIGLPMALLSLMGFFKTFKLDAKQIPSHQGETKKMFIILGSCVAFYTLIEILGMMLSLGIGVLLWFILAAKYHWLRSILYTVLIMAAYYAIFVLWLNVRLPTFLDRGGFI